MAVVSFIATITIIIHLDSRAGLKTGISLVLSGPASRMDFDQSPLSPTPSASPLSHPDDGLASSLSDSLPYQDSGITNTKCEPSSRNADTSHVAASDSEELGEELSLTTLELELKSFMEISSLVVEAFRDKPEELDPRLRFAHLTLQAALSAFRLQSTIVDSLKRQLRQHNVEISPQLASLTVNVRPPSVPSSL
ncbi:hypothetical protein MD484_g6521, partial [Candolleomyces efflorescens]